MIRTTGHVSRNSESKLRMKRSRPEAWPSASPISSAHQLQSAGAGLSSPCSACRLSPYACKSSPVLYTACVRWATLCGPARLLASAGPGPGPQNLSQNGGFRVLGFRFQGPGHERRHLQLYTCTYSCVLYLSMCVYIHIYSHILERQKETSTDAQKHRQSM